jgi:HlyD family secretion protein
MKISKFFFFLLGLFVLAAVIYISTTPRGKEIQLTGIVEGNEILVSPQIAGRMVKLYVDEGSWVKAGQLIAQLDPSELQAARDAAAENIRALQARLAQSSTTRDLNDQQTVASLRQAEASLTAVRAQLEQARANLALTEVTYKRQKGLADEGVVSAQARDEAESAYKASLANVKAFEDQVRASEAQVALAQANRKQVTVQESDVAATRAQLEQAIAQKNEAETQLGYTQIYSPLDGVVSVRVARQGEVVVAGGPIVTVVDADHMWVQADVEESYAALIAMGQKLKLRLPSSEETEGVVTFKGVENSFATQRDVSRTKRDIKTIEIKVTVPNAEHRLISGMTAYVLLPPPPGERSWLHF